MTVPPTWEDRDLPVLLAIVEHLEDSGKESFSPGILARHLPAFFEESDIQKSLRALKGHQPPVLSGRFQSIGNGQIYFVTGGVTGYARQVAGLWPKPGEFRDRLLQRLDEAEAAAADDDSKRPIQRIRAGVTELTGEALKQLFSGVVKSITG